MNRSIVYYIPEGKKGGRSPPPPPPPKRELVLKLQIPLQPLGHIVINDLFVVTKTAEIRSFILFGAAHKYRAHDSGVPSLPSDRHAQK